MKTILILFLFAGFANAQVSEQELAQIRDRVAPYVLQIKKSGNPCKDVVTKHGTAGVRGPRGGLVVELSKNRKRINKKELPSFGGRTQRCLEMTYFPDHEILVYKVHKGESSPAGIEATSLAVYKIVENRVLGPIEYMLLELDPDSDSDFVKTYRTFVRDGSIVLELTDHVPESPVIEEHFLNKLEWHNY